MIPTDHFLMKYFEFKVATSCSPHLQNLTITFDAARGRRLLSICYFARSRSTFHFIFKMFIPENYVQID